MAVRFAYCVGQPIGGDSATRIRLLANHPHKLDGSLAARNIACGKPAEPVRHDEKPGSTNKRLDRKRVFLPASSALDLSPGNVHARSLFQVARNAGMLFFGTRGISIWPVVRAPAGTCSVLPSAVLRLR